MAEKLPRDVLTYFDAKHREKRGLPAMFTRPKDAALAKRLLDTYDWAQITGLLDAFFAMRDDFIGKAGYSMGVFVSCLPKVIAEWDRQRAKAKRAIEVAETPCRDCGGSGFVQGPFDRFPQRCACRLRKASA